MDGFKDTTRMRNMDGGSCYAKGGAVKGAAKVSKVMGEFKSGKLHSGSKSGPEVTNPKQATAIALSEARKAGAKIPVQKKSLGGVLEKVAPYGLAGLIAGGGGLNGALAGSGIGLIAQLLKKKKANIPLTPVEQKQVDAAGAGQAQQGAQTTMKKGGMAKKGVPVAPKGPMVGLAAMPKKK